MKKQITRISILQSSKVATALYAILGCIYALFGIPMLIFGGEKLKIMGIIYIFDATPHGNFRVHLFCHICGALQSFSYVAGRHGN